MRVCVYARMYVRVCPFCRGQQNSTGCTQSRSDWKPEQEHKHQSDHRTQEHKRPPQAPGAGAGAGARIKNKIYKRREI